jgi:hypothetical protein
VSNDATDALIGLPLSAIGLVLALDVGGFTQWHVRASHQFVSFLRYIPPWRWLVKADAETLIRRGVIQERITGCVFAAFGLVLLASSLIHAMS